MPSFSGEVWSAMTVMNPSGVSRLSTWEVGLGVGLKGVSLEVVHLAGVASGGELRTLPHGGLRPFQHKSTCLHAIDFRGEEVWSAMTVMTPFGVSRLSTFWWVSELD